jgi:hypothetical protein
MDAAMATLITPYLAFLDSEHGASARVLAGVQSRKPRKSLIRPPPPPPEDVNHAAKSEVFDYAADW